MSAGRSLRLRQAKTRKTPKTRTQVETAMAAEGFDLTAGSVDVDDFHDAARDEEGEEIFHDAQEAFYEEVQMLVRHPYFQECESL